MQSDLIEHLFLPTDIIKFLTWDIWETILHTSLPFLDLKEIEKEHGQQYNLLLAVEIMNFIDVEMV